MRLRIRFQTPTLVRWLTKEGRECRLLLVDVDADALSEEIVNLSFNLVFSPKAVRRRGIVEADYYIGSTGAELHLRPSKGRIISYTKSQAIDVNYSNSSRRTRKWSVIIEPKASASVPSAEVGGSVGAAECSAGSEQEIRSSFCSSERILETEYANPEVKWIFALPRRENVIRDYLQGNWHLFAECESLKKGIEARLELRVSDIRFFGADRKPLGPFTSLLMRYELWCDGIHILSQAPESMKFKISSLEQRNG